MIMNNQTSIFDMEGKSVSGPLADRMRPNNLDDFEGQDHLLGKGKILRKLIKSDSITSMILWGPPGVGKTTLAKIIAQRTHAKFENFSAVLSGIKEIREVMKKAEERRLHGQRTLLFIDEIHRFNKSQQDAFLPFVEKGDIILIGATTENPSFELNSALLSRSKVFVLNPLKPQDITALLERAVKDEERGLGKMKIDISDEILGKLSAYANGDARVALNTLELAVLSTTPANNGVIYITDEVLEEAFQKKTLLYDKKGEEHYNLISAFHKSIRNSDSDAAVYWLARMLEAGEDPLYIARRMIRIASEDIGRQTLRLWNKQWQHFMLRILSVCRNAVSLAQAAVYLALAPKSNALYTGYLKAKEDAEKTIAQPVPMHIRNAPTELMRDLGYGKGYKYAHDFEKKVTPMECLPENLLGTQYYCPTNIGEEQKFKEKKDSLNILRKRYDRSR